MQSKQKTILVTGAAKGIGKAITKYLTSNGDRVIATDMDLSQLNKLKQRNIKIVEMNVESESSIKNAKKEIENSITKIDGLVNNAGIFIGRPLVEIEDKALTKIFQINVLGMARVTRIMFPLIKKAKGRIVNISSDISKLTIPFNGPYTMTKYAVESFSDALRRELMFHEIKVSIIQPGAVRTKLLEKTPKAYTNYIDESIFSCQIKKIYELSEKELKKGIEPRKVAKKVYKALHDKRPKIRYRINHSFDRKILSFLPERIVDLLLKIMLKCH